MNKKFSHEEGLTLIELLITLAVIAIVFAIAVPVFSNVLAGAQTSADTAQTSALNSFHEEYATTTLAFDGTKTTATLNGVVVASIKGDATALQVPLFNVNDPNVDYRYQELIDGANSDHWTPETPVLLFRHTNRVLYSFTSEADASAALAYAASQGQATTLASGTVSDTMISWQLQEWTKYSSDPTVVGARVLPLNY